MKIFRTRKLMIAISFTLILVLGVMAYFFINLNNRQLSPQKHNTPKGFKYLFSIYGFGNKKSEMLNHPNGIAIAKNGNIYVADQDNHRILVFTKKGGFLFKFGNKGSKRGQFESPMGVAVSPEGSVYVTDRKQNKVLIFNIKGKFKKEFKVEAPLTPAVYQNHLYLTTGSKLIMYNLDGNLVTEWGKRGGSEGQFNFPNGITFGKKDIIYIADTGNVRIKALNFSGEDLWITGNSLTDQKQIFGLPVSIATDERNRLYVVDAFPGLIHVFDNKGNQINKFGEHGTDDGQFNLPAQIAYAGNRVFFIVDKYNNRVQAIQIP